MTRLHLAISLALCIAPAVALTACDDADQDLGSPCETEEDCPEPLICDVHDGQGSCQRQHDHGEDNAGKAYGGECTEDDDCPVEQICDLHGEGGGWCAPPHDHDTGTSG